MSQCDPPYRVALPRVFRLSSLLRVSVENRRSQGTWPGALTLRGVCLPPYVQDRAALSAGALTDVATSPPHSSPAQCSTWLTVW